jgi:signal transduction histidine kinase
VDVTLQTKAGMLALTVVDNGRGFDRRDLPESECLGMAGMSERASLVGGMLEIQSRPDRGTQVCFRVPIGGDKGLVQ